MRLHAIGLSLVLILGLSLHSAQVASQSLTTPATSFPLVVRSPYFNAWILASEASPAGGWPKFWTGNTMGWAGFIRVDGVIYQWIGPGFQVAKTVASYITPTRSIFIFETGPILLNVTFLSPIEPSNLIRQSFPFSYLYADFASTDGKPHSIQFYSDMTAEWISHDNDDIVEWGTTITNSIFYQKMHLSTPQSMMENDNMPEDGTLYFALQKRDGITYQSGNSSDLRAYFNATGSLNNTDSPHFQRLDDNYPVIAMSVDLRDVMESTSPLVWAMGVIRDPVIRRTKGSTTEIRRSYYWTKFNTIEEAVDDFVDDFPAAQKRAIALDTKISGDGLAISQNYADILALSLRQVMASMDITVSGTSNGWNESDVQIYMKDVGTSRRSNPVDVLYASFPAFLYLNSSLAGYLLDPLLEFQSSENYNLPYAAPDLGVTYPDALGNSTGSELLAVESCGNMLIMAFAQASISRDTSRLVRYYDLWKTWADYLVHNSLHPSGMNADGERFSNMSNLALKSIVGIRVMAEISKAVESQSNQSNTDFYMSMASSLAKSWQDLAFNTDHISSTYGQPSSWGLIYNLFWDKFLKMNVVSQDIYDAQTKYYAFQSQSAGLFGLPYDSNDKDSVKPHWTMFAAAATTNTTTRDQLVSMIHARSFFNSTDFPFPSSYNAWMDDPASMSGMASPASGAMFALIADNLLSGVIPGPQSNADSLGSKHSSKAALIAGCVVGGVAFLGFLSLAIVSRKRRPKNKPTLIERFSGSYPHMPSNPDMRNIPQTSSDPVEVGSISPFLLSYSQKTASINDASLISKPQPLASSNLQEGQLYNQRNCVDSPPAESSNTSSSSTQNTPFYLPLSSPPVPPVDDLRNEVNEILRELREIRSQQNQNPNDPPPLYHEP